MRKTRLTMALCAACVLGFGSMPLFAQNSSTDQGGNSATFKRGTDGEPVRGGNDTQSGPQQSSQPSTATSPNQGDSAQETGRDSTTFKRGTDGEPASGQSSASPSDNSSQTQQGKSQQAPR